MNMNECLYKDLEIEDWLKLLNNATYICGLLSWSMFFNYF